MDSDRRKLLGGPHELDDGKVSAKMKICCFSLITLVRSKPEIFWAGYASSGVVETITYVALILTVSPHRLMK